VRPPLVSALAAVALAGCVARRIDRASLVEPAPIGARASAVERLGHRETVVYAPARIRVLRDDLALASVEVDSEPRWVRVERRFEGTEADPRVTVTAVDSAGLTLTYECAAGGGRVEARRSSIDPSSTGRLPPEPPRAAAPRQGVVLLDLISPRAAPPRGARAATLPASPGPSASERPDARP
jgi:hypothetical protein